MSLVKRVIKTFQYNFLNHFKLRSPFYGSHHFVLASITTTLSCRTNLRYLQQLQLPDCIFFSKIQI